jgi:dihydroorotate dehydrogenase
MAGLGLVGLAYRAVRPLIFRFEAERIHELTLRALRVAGENAIGRGLLHVAGAAPAGTSSAEVAGIVFRNRVGVGAGFDKNGVALRGWAALGLGFVEVGTVTPLPQPGNARPRLFRVPADEALINRMGFNNAGAAALARQVMFARRTLPPGFVVGVNIGRGHATPNERAVDDYREAYRLVAPVADYLVVNVSSPNTTALRELQDPAQLIAILDALADAGERLSPPPPVFVKVAPDLDLRELAALATRLAGGPARGLIVSNTSVARDGLRAAREVTAEPGGLSGHPLFAGLLERLACVRETVGDRLALIASGGIASAGEAAAAIGAGTDLVQLWTGLVYRGPSLIGAVIRLLR